MDGRRDSQHTSWLETRGHRCEYRHGVDWEHDRKETVVSINRQRPLDVDGEKIGGFLSNLVEHICAQASALDVIVVNGSC